MDSRRRTAATKAAFDSGFDYPPCRDSRRSGGRLKKCRIRATEREGNAAHALGAALSRDFARQTPVDQSVQDRVHVVRAPVLVVEIVSVLPDIDGQQRLEVFRQR